MLVGALDAAGLVGLRAAVAGLDELVTRRVVLDLRGLEAIDAPGVHGLLALASDAHAHGRELTLVRPPDGVMRTLAALGVDEHFSFVASPDRFVPPRT